MIPDAEKIVGDYLRTDPAVVALGAKVAGQMADSRGPWVKITQLDDTAVNGSRTDYLIEFMLQLDCYAGRDATAAEVGHREASLLSRTVRQALREMPDAQLNDAVVTGVEFVSNPRIPDTDFEPARERYARTVLIWMHP